MQYSTNGKGLRHKTMIQIQHDEHNTLHVVLKKNEYMTIQGVLYSIFNGNLWIQTMLYHMECFWNILLAQIKSTMY